MGDFNADGNVDLAVPHEADDSLWIFLGQGDGTLQQPRIYPVGSGSSDVVTGDFDGNGSLDLAVANYDSGSIVVLLGNGDGTYQDTPTLSLEVYPRSLAAGDLDNDGKLDLVTADLIQHSIWVLWGLGDEQSLLRTGVRLQAGLGPVAAEIGDFDGDGQTDLAVANSGDDNVYLLAGLGNGFFNDLNPTVLPAGNLPTALYAGHFDANPGLDLITLNYLSNDVTFYSSFDLSLSSTFSAGGIGPLDGVISDLNYDSFDDLIIANNGDRSLSLLWGGAGGFAAPQTILDGLPYAPAALELLAAEAGVVDLIVAFDELDDVPAVYIIDLPSRPGGLAVPVLPEEEIGSQWQTPVLYMVLNSILSATSSKLDNADAELPGETRNEADMYGGGQGREGGIDDPGNARPGVAEDLEVV